MVELSSDIQSSSSSLSVPFVNGIKMSRRNLQGNVFTIVKYLFELSSMRMVVGTLLYVILIIIAVIIIIFLLRYLFQLFFVIPTGTDHYGDILYAKGILLSMNYDLN
jgi:hypothetical protein